MNRIPIILRQMMMAGGGEPGIPVPVPTGFDYTPSFNVLQSGSTYSTDFDAENYQWETSITYYFDADTGNDANSGLTPELPKKNIDTMVTALNAAPPVNGATFSINGTFYSDNSFVGSNDILFDLMLIATGSRAKVTKIRPGVASFALAAANRYTHTGASGLPGHIIDTTYLDELGNLRKLTAVTSNAAVTGGQGVIFEGSTTTSFNLWDARDPNTGLYTTVFPTQRGSLFSFRGRRLYVENIDFWGSGNTVVKIEDPFIDFQKAIFVNCNIGFGGWPTNLTDTLYVNDLKNLTHELILYQTNVFGGIKDGANYNESNMRAAEINCNINRNGQSSGGANNGSTCHLGSKIIRVGGNYSYNQNRNIHDVNTDTQSWNLGISAGFPTNNGADDFNFGVGTAVASGEAIMWLDGCQSLGGAAKDIWIYAPTILRYRNMDLSGLVVDNDGTLETY